MVEEGKLEEIEEFARNHYIQLDETHGIEHMERTIELAEYLAEKEGADREVVRLGASLHQIHDAGEVREFLESTGIDEDLVEELAHCVRCSELENIDEAETVEAKVVFDADKLQVVGPFGIMREIACDVGAREKGFRESLEHTREIEEKCFEKLQTETGRRIGRKHHEELDSFWKLFDEMDDVNIK